VKVTASAVSLNVEDVAASSRFLHQHFGFAGVMAAGGFASLARRDIGVNVVYSRRGRPALPGDQRGVHATGVILVFAVGGLEGELARLQAEGAQITMPLTCEEWGSGPSRSATPSGVVIQLPSWNVPTATLQPALTCSGTSAGRDPKREYEREVASGPHA
jgi:predicted enzyme related to lactoylglutathione lyase